MAIIATCIQPYPNLASVDHVPIPVAQRFPVPKQALGGGVDVASEWVMDSLISPYYINGALSSEGSYLELTIGQIWPRIG